MMATSAKSMHLNLLRSTLRSPRSSPPCFPQCFGKTSPPSSIRNNIHQVQRRIRSCCGGHNRRTYESGNTRISPNSNFGWQSERQFSTAVAKQYSCDEDSLHDNSKRGLNPSAAYDSVSVKEPIGSGNIKVIGDLSRERPKMPRLQALRERLQLEKQRERFNNIHFPTPSDNRMLIPASDHTKNNFNSTNIQIEENNAHDTHNILTDSYGRHHNYLRISLSERCNLRCQYCMPPEGIPLSPSSHLLTNKEVIRLVKLFSKNGVNKVRLTGGEPLLRQDLIPLVGSISDVLKSSMETRKETNADGGLVGITTNGISLSRHIHGLVEAGLTGVNISLDTLRDDRFLEITRRKGLNKVLRSIGDSIDAFRKRYGDVRVANGGSRVKVNCVVMKGFNDDELADFVQMANDTFDGEIDMRFIEWMPFNDNGWNRSRFVSYQDMMDKISRGGSGNEKMSPEGMPLERIGDGPNDTTKWWRVKNAQNGGTDRTARIGFITSMSEHFCSTCNRLRITADGKIKTCLFGSNEKEVSLRDIMRQNEGSVDEGELSNVISAAVQRKTLALGGHGNPDNIAKAADNRPMTLIGG